MTRYIHKLLAKLYSVVLVVLLVTTCDAVNARANIFAGNGTNDKMMVEENGRSKLICKSDSPRCSNPKQYFVHKKSAGRCVELCVSTFRLQGLNQKRFKCGPCPKRTSDTRAPTIPAPAISIPISVPSTDQSSPTKVPVSFAITLDMTGMTTSDTLLFEQAAARWSNIIVADIEDVSTTNLVPSVVGCNVPSIVDDLHICSEFSPVDGPRGILGFAGPEYVRLSNGLPILGSMGFDSDDVTNLRNDKSLYNVILHEMGHIVGVGTLWVRQQVTGKSSQKCPYKSSSNAGREYSALTGCNNVPTEQDGGSGTRCGHFDEECMDTELMTGYLNGSPSLSRITIGTLQDLGYSSVDYTLADPYSRQDIRSQCWCNRRLSEKSIGDTRPRRRKLSEEGMLVAKAYGTNLLQSRRWQKNTKTETAISSTRISSDIQYVGDKMISILYLEGNNIYEVDVSLKD